MLNDVNSSGEIDKQLTVPVEHTDDKPIDLVVEDCWQDFWIPILGKDGVLDMGQLKKELWDFKQLMRNASIVYDYVTRSKISNVLTVPDAVIGVADECQEEAIKYAIDEFFDEGDFEGLDKEAVAVIREYMGRWFGKLPVIPLYEK